MTKPKQTELDLNAEWMIKPCKHDKKLIGKHLSRDTRYNFYILIWYCERCKKFLEYTESDTNKIKKLARE